MSVYHLLSKNPHPKEKEIRRAIAGNTCRCTGYQNVLRAIEFAAKSLEEGKK
jgi:aerobic carbon-monoxide dehydrogenase small subunit